MAGGDIETRAGTDTGTFLNCFLTTMNKEFHERFNIPISTDGAKERFVNRVKMAIFGEFWSSLPNHVRRGKDKSVLVILGLRENPHEFAPSWVEISDEFWLNVQALEALCLVLPEQRKRLSEYIQNILDLSEIDLGIRWYQGRFIPSGSSLLDDKLVNDVLGCLQSEKYDGVRGPFIKGLEHLLHSISKPQLHPDVVTDMYEALEALAKIVTGRGDKDLSSNAELFVKAVQVSELYRPILKEYVVYGNKIRHAGRDGQPKPDLTRKEVESFVYLTGVFIRLAVIEEAQA